MVPGLGAGTTGVAADNVGGTAIANAALSNAAGKERVRFTSIPLA